MKRTSYLSSLLGLLLLLLSACAGSDETHFTRLGLGEAESIFLIANGDNGFDELAFRDDKQEIRKVRYYDDKDQEIEFEGHIGIKDVNEKYFLMTTASPKNPDNDDQTFRGYVVRKTDGATFLVEPYQKSDQRAGETTYSFHFTFVYSDANQNMYLNFGRTKATLGEAGEDDPVREVDSIPVRINVSDDDILSWEELPGTTSFVADAQGHTMHWAADSARLIHPSGRIENIPSVLAFWRGIEDIFVLTGDSFEEETLQVERVVKNRDGDLSLEVSDLKIQAEDTQSVIRALGSAVGAPTNIRERYLLEDRLIVIDNEGVCVEVENPEKMLRVHTECQDIGQDNSRALTLDGRAYYRVEKDSGAAGIFKYDIVERADKEILPALDYDFGIIELLDEGVVYFEGLRFSDGAEVVATVDDSGEVTIWDEKPFQGKIETLIRIR